MPGTKRIYWDANVIISYIEGRPDRASVLEALLHQSSQDTIEIITSTLTIAEVAFAESERAKGSLDPGIAEKIDTFWNDPKAVRLAEVHPVIARDARDLIRSGIPKGWSGLKPADAIHLATASSYNCAEFHTYEGSKLQRYSQQLQMSIGEPTTGQLMFPPSP